VIELIVVRHGETDWNRIRRLQGQTDIALNATGIEQAAQLASALANEPIEAIHSSDLSRATATAEPVAARLGLSIRTDPRLRERHYGILEGRTFGEILEALPEHAESIRLRDPDHAVEGGESPRVFFGRAVAAISEIASAESLAGRSKILVVTHGGVLDMLYRHADGLSLEVERPCLIPNAVINRMTFDDGRFTIVSWAEET
jgi:2,3-bisphosphoglycerate-dependent phosphoglycerate mutase